MSAHSRSAPKRQPERLSSMGIALRLMTHGKPDWFLSSPDQYRYVYHRNPVIESGYTVVMPGFGEVCVHLIVDPVDDKPKFVMVAWAVCNPFARRLERKTAHLTSLSILRGFNNARTAKMVAKHLGTIVDKK